MFCFLAFFFVAHCSMYHVFMFNKWFAHKELLNGRNISDNENSSIQPTFKVQPTDLLDM